MATPAAIKPTQKALQTYYAALQTYADQGVENESALRSAFQNLLEETGRHFGWTLIPERAEAAEGRTVRPDGTFRDDYYITHGYWEAKDTNDNLEIEIKKKIAQGYPLTNIIFEDTRQAHLYQNGRQAMKVDLGQPRQLADLLNAFFGYTAPAHQSFEKAIGEFQQRVPDLARGLVEKINHAHQNNPRFIQAFTGFYDLCRTSLNPNLRREAVDEMLVQHLLTERLIGRIFDNPDFTRRNVIAAEVEKVIDALVSKAFDRHEFLRSLDRFYLAIESAATTIESFTEKQHFLNSVYERFFQGYSVKVADTHGIVYTPQEIVNFMCASVAEVLENEFGKTLGDEGVHILDPCTGTGNFIVNILRRIPKRDLPRMYRQQLFANEVMLLPYYIAALNIEHAYYEQTGAYEPFEGMCFVDTLDLAEPKQNQLQFMTEANTARVRRQKLAPITVILGNPPYNIGQLNENDNNKNRAYPVIDKRIRETYAAQSNATLTSKLYDPYVKFLRWATDRLAGRDGIVCFITNNSFVDQTAFDGMRKCLHEDFARIYHLDLQGNVRRNPTLSGTAYNVFGIQVGVGVTLAMRRKKQARHQIRYFAVPLEWRRHQKLQWLATSRSYLRLKHKRLMPDETNTWLRPQGAGDFARFLPMGTKEAKESGDIGGQQVLFKTYCLGVSTNRDTVVYDFSRASLIQHVTVFCEAYNAEVDRFRRHRSEVQNIDDFIDYSRVKWSSTLKRHLQRCQHAQFADARVRLSLYRPFTKQHLYYDRLFVDRPALFSNVLPDDRSEQENALLCVPTVGNRGLWTPIAASLIPNLNMTSIDAFQCFPFYVYDEDGSHRRENVTDWALKQFRGHYRKKKLTKWDIFYYVYGILHHPGYRERFAENLKRELPRIPLAPDFRAFATAGERLARLHLDYEKLEPWPLQWVETPGVPLSYRVEKMRLSKDKTALKVNDSLTLGGIPPEVFEYRLGNRSALEWVIDQYRVSEDKRSGIRSDPNRPDDPEYIVRLVGQVVRVSLETVRIIRALPADFGGGGH
jgi:predicted helicase